MSNGDQFLTSCAQNNACQAARLMLHYTTHKTCVANKLKKLKKCNSALYIGKDIIDFFTLIKEIA